MPEYLTRKEACSRLRISEQTLDRLLEAKKLRRVRVSDRRVLIPAEDVERILSGAQGATGAAP